VLPFERLRALARYAGDDRGLVLEATDCLADFADDPTQLVTVCRRLLAHHPSNGALWWVCAQVLAGTDPAGGARDAARRLERDRTASRLASLLPFPHDEPIAVLGWPDTVGAALTERPDLATGEMVLVESRMPETIVAGLQQRGHKVEVLGPYENAMGHAHGIVIDAERGTLAGGSDPRADSLALGL